MANNKKRVLSLLMAAVMMLGTIPMNAFAFFFGNRKDDDVESETRLVCENEKHHDHTDACGHKHNALCRLPQTSCYKRLRLVCDHRGYHCGKSSEALECGYEAHNSNCYAAVEEDQKIDTNIDSSMTVTAQFEENKPAVYENVKVKLTVNGVTRRIVKLGTVEHGTVITTQWLHDNKLMDINCYLANDVVIDRDGEFSVEFVDTNVTLVFWNGTDKMKTVTLLVANGIEITNQWLYDNNLLDSNYVLDENAAFEKVIDEAGEYNIFVRAK